MDKSAMKYSITEANLKEDANVIVQLWKKNLLGYKNYKISWILKKYLWYYNENPFSQEKIWLLKTPSDEDVGSLAVGSRQFKASGRELMFGLGGNFFVDRNHRTLGPAVMLQRMFCSQVGKGIDAAYIFAPKHAIPALKRAGFVEIGSKIRMAKMLKATTFITKIVRYQSLAALLSLFVDNIIRIFSRETWRRLPKKFTVKHIEEFDDEFDSLWESVSKKYPVISKKTAEIMNWRYKKCPYRTYKIFGIFDKKDQTLLSYIIYYLPEDEKGHVLIFDCLFDPEQKVFEFLLSEFVKYLRKEKMCTVSFEFFGIEAVIKQFASYGFHIRQESATILIYCGDDKQMLSTLKNKENWFLTAGDDNG